MYASGGGKDVVTDYATNDKIKITSGSISKASLSGSAVVLTVGSDSIKLKNAANKLISTVNTSNKTTGLILGSTGGKSLNGGSNADSIVAGSGADTLKGGKGADTLTGGGGKDVFVYASGDGNDVITDYTASDKIKITGGTYSTVTSGNDIKIKVGSGSILLKNAKGRTLNINSSNSNFEERWFLENSLIQDSELDSIINEKNNYISENNTGLKNYKSEFETNEKNNFVIVNSALKKGD